MRIKTYLLLLGLILLTSLNAQIGVESFRVLENDLEARVNPVKDQNGDNSALIKVVTTETGFSFEGGMLGIVKTVNKTAEIWVYVPWGLKRLTITHPKLGMLRDYMIPVSIEKATVYEMKLVTGKVVVTVEKEEIESQWLIIQPTPANASVYMDDAYINKGIYQAKLKPGSYTYRVEAPMYHTTVGKIQITDKKEELNITLKPNFGYIKISSTPESNAQVLIDDKPLAQHTPVRSDTLKSGEYTVKVIKELYQPFAQKVMVEDEKTTEINAILQPNYGELNIYAPEASTIYLNNIEKGKGSWTSRLPAGIYSLEARLASHQTAKEDVEIKVGDNKIVNLHPKPIYGSVDIMTTNIPDVNIQIDGKDYGITPHTVKLLTGNYTLKLSKKDYATIEKPITIKESSNDIINETMVDGKKVTINSTPTNIDLYIDGKHVGKTPYKEYLSFGSHELRIEDGVVSSEKTIELNRNQTDIEFLLYINAVFDIEGNVYQTVKIGDQEWMAENLKVTRYNNGSEIPNIINSSEWMNTKSPAYCYYDNKIEKGKLYGALYNWYVVNTDKLCPKGWHVPSDEEWTDLVNYLVKNNYNYDGTVGGELDKINKAMASDKGWEISVNKGAVGNTDYPEYRNKSGFSALPGGCRSQVGMYEDIKLGGSWWSSTGIGIYRAYTWILSFDYFPVFRGERDKRYGFSVRCVKDK